jgi:hypothetical protein
MIPALPSSSPLAPAAEAVVKHFRRLKMNELVARGDFVADPQLGFKPWEGPTGFRADSFVKPIYRRATRPNHPAATE